jgi:hypothetical protein
MVPGLGRWEADALVGLCTPFSRRWRGEGTVYRRACVHKVEPQPPTRSQDCKIGKEPKGRRTARIMFLFD